MNGYYVQYAYNNAGQKTGVKIWNGTTASYDVSYEYYANGWLKAVKSGAQTIASYSYDDNGALTAVKTADGQTEQESFTYYPSGLMNGATFGSQTITNVWDANEHRVQFSIGEDDCIAVFDVTAGIPAVIKEITPTETIYYVREPGGELICRVVGESRWYYHFDELGSTRLVTDGNGAVTDRYAYDAYGAVISHDRNTGTIDQPYQYVGQLGYYAHWMAPEFGWMQLGVRFYEPELGRFERRDPVDNDLESSFSYASGSVLNGVDPSGTTIYSRNNCLKLLGKITQLTEKVLCGNKEAESFGGYDWEHYKKIAPAWNKLQKEIKRYKNNCRDKFKGKLPNLPAPVPAPVPPPRRFSIQLPDVDWGKAAVGAGVVAGAVVVIGTGGVAGAAAGATAGVLAVIGANCPCSGAL